MLLRQYKQSGGRPVTSCKQLNNSQLEDLLAICESLGWQCPGKEERHFNKKVASRTYGVIASFAQQQAIKYLMGDLGWTEIQLAGMIKRLTEGKIDSISQLTTHFAYNVIEALKAILGRHGDKHYKNLDQIEKDFSEVTDGKTNQAS